MIHLDTSFLIQSLKPGSPEDRRLRRWIEEGETLVMSTVAWSEFLCGPLDRSEMELATEIVGQRRDFTPKHATYDLESFERCLAEMFRVLERQPLASGTRLLYYGQPKT